MNNVNLSMLLKAAHNQTNGEYSIRRCLVNGGYGESLAITTDLLLPLKYLYLVKLLIDGGDNVMLLKITYIV